jgi:hypothetical protein
MRKFLALALIAGTALLSACGGGSDDPPLVAANDAVLSVNPVAAVAVAQTPFSFPAGVPALGTTATTTVVFTSTASSPSFSIASGGATATGVTSFGSCIFVVTSSTFPTGHPLAQGQTVTVNPCNLRIGTAGAQANGVAQSRSIALLLGAAASANQSATVGVNAGGQLTLNGNSMGTVTLTPISGG